MTEEMTEDPDTVVVEKELIGEGEPQMGEACLVTLYGGNIGRRYFLKYKEQIIGRSEAAHIHVDQDSVSRQHAKVVVDGSESRVVDLGSTNGTFLNNTGISDSALRDGDLLRIGQTIFKYLSGSNIEQKYHEEIYNLTTVDALTGAYNKRYFEETLERELSRSLRYGRILSLVLFDLDHFKRLNDTLGHLGGDDVLRTVGEIVLENIRGQDVFARYGGEEFALILPEINLEAAYRVCEKLRALIAARMFGEADKAMRVTASFGLYAYDPQTLPKSDSEGSHPSVQTSEAAIDPQTMIARADACLYKAKNGGRNQVVRFRDADDQASTATGNAE